MAGAALAAAAGTSPATVERLEASTEPDDWGAWDRCMSATLPPRSETWDEGYEADALLAVRDRAPRPPGYWERIDAWWAAFRAGWYGEAVTLP